MGRALLYKKPSDIPMTDVCQVIELDEFRSKVKERKIVRSLEDDRYYVDLIVRNNNVYFCLKTCGRALDRCFKEVEKKVERKLLKAKVRRCNRRYTKNRNWINRVRHYRDYYTVDMYVHFVDQKVHERESSCDLQQCFATLAQKVNLHVDTRLIKREIKRAA